MINGVFSVLSSATAGTSMGVIDIRDGSFRGNDISGARYQGTAVRKPDGSVEIEVSMATPPDVFHIWRGDTSNAAQTVTLKVTLPKESFDDGKPHFLKDYGAWVMFKQIPADRAPLAGPDGYKIIIRDLIQAQEYWNRQTP